MSRAFADILWLETATIPDTFTRGKFACGFEGIGFTPTPSIHRVKQVHGTKIEVCGPATLTALPPEADGLTSSTSGQRVAVKTADCLPIIIGSFRSKKVSAVHAGWRGLAGGILHQGLQEFAALGDRPEDICVAVGPSITLPNYEVGPDVVEAFSKSEKFVGVLEYCLYKGRADRWQIDLGGIAAQVSLRFGLPSDQIAVIRSCTFAHSSKWNSYRREGKVIASNWSWAELL